MRHLFALVLASLVLAGCYETVNEKQSREQMQRDIKDLQRRDR